MNKRSKTNSNIFLCYISFGRRKYFKKKRGLKKLIYFLRVDML